ncbi:MAG: PIG-L family deacetylase [Herpetosiphonaceae bacterium]|nr:PIG-L family deacetylase [Herpetosiphonaceae bacterium]
MLLAGLYAAENYDHIFIAPHLDDVALSCGGLVALQVAQGQRTLVVTICAGSAGPALRLTPYIAYLHATWNLGDDPIALRREEDIRALAQLNVDGLHLDELDAVYRDPAYGSRDGIFGALIAHDPLVAAATVVLTTLRQQNPAARMYLPLAVGNHVDHQAVWAARQVLVGTSVAFYEDFPYAAQPQAVPARIATLGDRLVPELVPIEPFLPRRLAAIAEYRSQQSELFHGAKMEDVVVRYAAAVDGYDHYSERLWLPQS